MTLLVFVLFGFMVLSIVREWEQIIKKEQKVEVKKTANQQAKDSLEKKIAEKENCIQNLSKGVKKMFEQERDELEDKLQKVRKKTLELENLRNQTRQKLDESLKEFLKSHDFTLKIQEGPPRSYSISLDFLIPRINYKTLLKAFLPPALIGITAYEMINYEIAIKACDVANEFEKKYYESMTEIEKQNKHLNKQAAEVEGKLKDLTNNLGDGVRKKIDHNQSDIKSFLKNMDDLKLKNEKEMQDFLKEKSVRLSMLWVEIPSLLSCVTLLILAVLRFFLIKGSFSNRSSIGI